MIRLLISILRFFGLIRWAAALDGGSKAYQDQMVQEVGAAQEKLQSLVDQIYQEVEDAKKTAHEDVVAAVDPDSVVDEQLLNLYAAPGDESSSNKTY